MRIYLAGDVRIEAGGRIYDDKALGGRQPRLAFAMLVLDRDRAVPREELTEAIWPDEPPRTWESALRNIITKVRGYLAAAWPSEELLTASFGCYQVRLPDGTAVDIEVEGALDDADAALCAGAAHIAVEIARAADAVLAEPFLPGNEGAWVDGIRQHLGAARSRALRILAEAGLRLGDPHAAVCAAEALLEIEPFREDAHRLCMRSHTAAGNRAQALWAYERCRTLLRDELGVDPSPDTEAVYLELLRDDAGVAQLDGRTPWRPPSWLGAHDAGDLIGRDKELAALREVLAACRPGRGAMALVSGEPGVGKTRLVQEIASTAVAGGAAIVGASVAGRPPIDGLADCVRWLLGGLRTDDLAALEEAHLAALRSLVGNIWIPSGHLRPNGSADLPEACRRLFALVAERRPVVVVLDDADAQSAELLGPLARKAGVFAVCITDHDVIEADITVRLAPLCHDMLAGLLPESPFQAAAAQVLYAETGGLPGRVVDVLRVLPSIADEAPLPDRIRLAAVRCCPYKGLLAYEPQDADRFVGREDVVADVLEKLREEPVVGLVGQSGSGKSSLLRAGLVPVLRDRDGNVAVLTPGAHPVDALDHATRADALLVDQFEELFFVCTDAVARRTFCDRLVGLAAGGVAVVVAIRADAYGLVTFHRELATLIERATVLVKPMEPAEMRRVVVEPALRAGYRVEPGLPETIVADIGEEGSALPALSHVLLETWRQRRGPHLTAAVYRAAGGARGAIARSAETAFRSLTADEQRLARTLLMRLVVPGDATEDSRRPVPVHGLLDMAGTDGVPARPVFDELVRARLVSIDEHGTAMIAHESLLREWPRLRAWIDDNRDALRTERHLDAAATEWERLGRPDGELYRGERVVAVTDWIARDAPALTARQAAFVKASIAASEREAQRQRTHTRRLRRLLAATAVGVVLALVAGLIAAVQRNRARGQAQLTQVRRLATEAGAAAAEDPPLALNLAVEAYRRRPDLAETRSALLTALLGQPLRLATLPTRTEVLAVAGSADGRVALGADGEITVWNAADGRRLKRIPVRGAAFGQRAMTFVPDGRIIALTTAGDVMQWDGATGRRAHPTIETGLAGGALSVDGAGERAVVAAGSRVAVLDLRGARIVAGPHDVEAASPTVPQTVASLSGDGRTVVVYAAPGVLRVLDAIDLHDRREAIPLPASLTPNRAQMLSTDRHARFAVLGAFNSITPVVELGSGRVVHEAKDASGLSATVAAFTALAGQDVLLVAGQGDTRLLSLNDFSTRTAVPASGRGTDTALAGDVLVAGGRPSTVWSIDDRTALWRAPRRPGAVAWHASPDGRHIGTIDYARAERPIEVWELATGETVGRFDNDLYFVSDDRIRWYTGGVIRLTDLAGKDLRPPYRLPSEQSFTAIDPSGSWLSWGDHGDGFAGVHLVNLRTSKPVRDIPLGDGRAPGEASSFQYEVSAFDRAGQRLAVVGHDMVKIVSVPNGRAIFERKFQDAVGVNFSGDGRRVIVSTRNRAVLLDPATGLQIGPQAAETKDFLQWAELDRTGSLAAVSSDNTVQLFDTRTGVRIGGSLPAAKASFGMFVRDGLVLTTDRGTVVMPLDPEVWARTACRVAGTNLSMAEWRRFLPLERAYQPACAGKPARR